MSKRKQRGVAESQLVQLSEVAAAAPIPASAPPPMPAKPEAEKSEVFSQKHIEKLKEAWGYSSPESVPYVPFGAKSFADLAAAEEAQEASETVRQLNYQFGCLITNLIGDSTVTAKLPALRALSDEFLALIAEALGEATSGDEEPTDTEATETDFAESESGRVIELKEASLSGNPRDPLTMDIVLIRPGFGNRRDNHYYPRAILERDAKVFEGVKMYASDHRDDEKSVRTEVSRVDKITGFTEDGEPIARVQVFDPNFAEAVRNRAKLNALDSLECSILASGRAHRGSVGGKPANIVDVITGAKSVDWVTKGGAGGRALRLAETEPNMPKKIVKKTTDTTNANAETVVAEVEGEDVTIAESTTPTTGGTTPAPAAPPTPPDEPEDEEEISAEEWLGEADATQVLSASNLPQAARKKLAEKKYHTADELKAAISAEVKYLKEVSGSGKPFNVESAASSLTPTRPLAEVNKTKDAINQKYLRG